MKNISDLLKTRKLTPNVRNKHEYQAYGNRLAEEFGDIAHRALYIKLAKETDRSLLEQAREFVLASEKATTRGRLFMWKLTQLKNLRKEALAAKSTE